MGESLRQALIRFIEYHPPKKLKKNLFSVFLEFVYSLGSGSPVNLDDILFACKELFELLDTIEDKIEKLRDSKNLNL
ncbi:hypothetical protein [Chryseobacterium sp. ISL-6]|uniref:hypothetical protein n=1 Tax=Chryseobacterium sp. ISL-6 TaxID=2819143 RepID=UPI001BE57C9C|nr:hypothetical protein [Chryseobacterium sp. ISL-6]MBT2623218.1 hypothetical protein [Chryseobacterium sp. ISL-6]